MEMIEDYREKLLVFTKEKIKLVGGYLKKFRDTDWKKQFQDLLLRVRESGERLFKLVGENVDLAFKRAFGMWRKKNLRESRF